MAERIYSRPVIPLLISMMSGITVGLYCPGHGMWAWVVISVLAGYLLYLIKQDETALISPVILFFAAGYLSLQPWVVPKLPPNHIIHYVDTHRWGIVGVIDKNPVEYGRQQKFILRTETLRENNKSFPVSGKLRVTVMGDGPELSAGDRVSFSSRIRSIRNFNNPGGFDYKRYMLFKRIWGTAYARGEKLDILSRNPEPGISRVIENARDKISGLIETAGEGDQKGILKALIVGERNQIEPSLKEAFYRAGVGHLLAISGLHIGIVATVAFIFFSWILSHFKLFLWNAWTNKGAAVLSLFPVFVYGLLSGMSPSTQRAVIMVTVFLVAFIIEREHDLINTLALAAMLILIVHPPSLFSISFQLSFVAVLSIIYGLSHTYYKTMDKQEWRFKLPQKLFSFLLVSFFAILGTMPLAMFYFNQVSLVGLLANLLIVPLVGFIVVPLGLVSVFLYPLSSSGASICIKASAAVLGPGIDIIRFLAEMPFAAVKTVTPTCFEIGCFYLLAWAILNIIKFKPETSADRHRFSRQKVATIVAVAVIFALLVDTCYWLQKRFWHDDLRVTIIDVGKGSSALLEMPGGINFLIDGGGFSDNSIFDVGARVIAPFLWRKKIKTVDTLILSHPNSDHLNGLLYIAQNFHVQRVLANNEAANIKSYQRFMEIIERENIHLPRFMDLPRMQTINGVQLHFLYPPEDFLQRKKERWRNPNNNSLVVKAVFGSKSILFPGDIQARAEKELVSMGKDTLQSTVLIAPHHGSRTSSTAEFLDAVKPELAVISSGGTSSYKFPHPSVLKRYKERGCRILRTDCNGAVMMVTDGRSLKIKPAIKD